MFCYQENLASTTLPLDEAQFFALVKSTQWNGNIDKFRETGDQSLKRKLPAFIFQATFDETLSKKGILGRWRKQAATRLTGLCVMDVDHVESEELRAKREEFTSEDFKPKAKELGILLVYVTPSGHGLKIVFKARPEWGNLIDNQHQMAKLLGVEVDESCKDASRLSFICKEEDILFLDKELFTYENKEFAEKYDEAYRAGSSKGVKEDTEVREVKEVKEDCPNSQFSTFNSQLSYHNVPYSKITEEWMKVQGGAPAVGDRHRTMLLMALDLRYICDNNPEMVVTVLKQCEFVQDVIRERGEEEIVNAATDVCARKLYKDIPKRMQEVLANVGIYKRQPTPTRRTTASSGIPYELFAQRLEPLLSSPYKEACKGVTRENWLGAVYAAGAMYCTLMTRTWYTHFSGAKQRMNPQVLIVGHPASGKSFAKDLDDYIMQAMRVKDEDIRLQESRYKKEQKKRGTSIKAQNQDALLEPEGMIRYLPTNTSNNIFFRRLKRAKESVNGEDLPLHLYMFDSELDSSINAQSGGTWIGKHDLELKAFHNELSGVDYANNDSINALLPVYWNSVTTGTSLSLYKKFTRRNINDGLCSRMAFFQMDRSNFKMVRKKIVDHQNNETLKQWGYKFEALTGELPLERLTEHVYNLCALSAQEADDADDLVLDYLRKRAVFYATWFTVPRIVARQYDYFKNTGQLDITDDDLKFSTLIYDSVIYFQDYLFGQMLQDSWDNADREYVPRRKNSKNAEAYKALPDTFCTKDVMTALGLEDNSARQQCKRWITHGFIERLDQGQYIKIIKEIFV